MFLLWCQISILLSPYSRNFLKYLLVTHGAERTIGASRNCGFATIVFLCKNTFLHSKQNYSGCVFCKAKWNTIVLLFSFAKFIPELSLSFYCVKMVTRMAYGNCAKHHIFCFAKNHACYARLCCILLCKIHSHHIFHFYFYEIKIFKWNVWLTFCKAKCKSHDFLRFIK